ncbi:hypothetical protein R3P38DRAFT_3166948 [Favolaschia claudopus]|uniref:Peroxisome membrane anchor protein Pex14p N-terminal domain-containing protein n=1 Tax=Favolaschia claudopus TaxID=2862362 RepID=A0AAW0ECR1_9AGAR
MSDSDSEGGKVLSTSSEATQSVPDATPSPSAAQASGFEDRVELLNKARAFLHQPQIQREDVLSKRRFLAEKGLNDAEIEGLMRELPVQIPSIPPRTYPQPPPSNLPTLLLGLVRLFSWIIGGAAALSFIYYRILLPRVTATYMARGSLKSHQLSLIRKLNTSLASLKDSQNDVAEVLPRPGDLQEPSAFKACLTLDALLEHANTHKIELSTISQITLLRCAISDPSIKTESKKPTTTELFHLLEGKIPWLASDEGASFEQSLWDTLSTCSLFVSEASPSDSVLSTDSHAGPCWTYQPPAAPAPTALAHSLSALSASIPKPHPEKHSPFQHALQSMSDFTGYISSQMYAPYLPVGNRFGTGPTLNTAEEEVRKEIRALKGLVLNR